MSTPEPKPSQWTPSLWVTVASMALSALIASAVTASVMRRDVDDLRIWQRDAQAWMVAMDKRMAANEQTVAVSVRGLEKDMQAVTNALNNIQAALMGRTASPVIAPATGCQPYP